MNISTLARRVGLSPSGVRWYEAEGIVPPPARRDNGYRAYTEADVSRLRLILTLRRLGLGPFEAGRLAAECLAGDSTDADLASTLARQRRRIGEQREELARLEIELRDLETTVAAGRRARGRRAEPPASPIGVLFVCNGNSARSQLGEALLGLLGGDDFAPFSAGTRPRSVHPLAVQVLAEVGVDWSDARAKPVAEILDRPLDYVITLSDSAREECPVLPGRHNALHWHLDDPAALVGSEEERLQAFRATRTEISVRLPPFVEIARRAAGLIPPISGPEPAPVLAAEGAP